MEEILPDNQSSMEDIRPTDNDILNTNTIDSNLILELGDRVLIDSTLYGRVVGTIYYRDGLLIRILPDGITDRLYDFPRIYTDEDDKFIDDIGVSASYVLEKAKLDGFANQHSLFAGQVFETIGESGIVNKYFRVTEFNTDEDSINIVDENDDASTIIFGFVGIPIDHPYSIIRIRSPPEMPETDIDTLPDVRQEKDIPTTTPDLEPSAEDIIAPPQPKKPTIRIIGVVNVPKMEILHEAKVHEKVYPDSVQKVDALNDFINMLDPVAQKDKNALRAVRILVESLHYLKQAIVEKNLDGSVAGVRSTSVRTLAQLLQNYYVPLARPVLDTSIRLYAAPEDEDADISPVDTEEYYFVKFLKEFEEIQSESYIPPVSGSGDTTQHFWKLQQIFTERFMNPWRASSANPSPPVFKSIQDTDFFRGKLPNIETPDIKGYTAAEEFPVLGDLNFSILRALSATYRKEDGKKKIQIPADAATIRSFVLFPSKAGSTLGTTRSGSIACDSGRSTMPIKTMHMLLQKLGDIQDITTSDGILALGVSGNTLGNISIKDYIDGIRVIGTGMTDVTQILADLGMSDIEINSELFSALETQFKKEQHHIRNAIATLRNVYITTQSRPDISTTYNFINEPAILEKIIRTEPILVSDIDEYSRQNPELSKSDIALSAHLLKTYSIYFQTAAGQHPLYIAKERFRATRDIFLENLRISNQVRKNEREKGTAPVINRCEHVGKLRTIRGVRDDIQRYELLTKFLVQYQGKRDKNFIQCILCEKKLLCIHERLQIQAFLNPKEQSILNKEIILSFSGGQFSGHYICRNCGQPIEEVSYDTNIEYDDTGRPMMGRAILIDKDELAEETLTSAVSGPMAREDVKFATGAENTYYQIIRQIAERIGVFMEADGYRCIVANILMFMGKLPNKAMFDKIKARMKMEYETFINRNAICSAGVFLLIEVQTKIPDYIIRYPLEGCIASFNGVPLGADNDRRGLEYIACAIASIMSDTAPWNLSGFQKERQDKNRQTIVLNVMQSIVDNNSVKNDAAIQQNIVAKKKYLSEKFGVEVAEGRPAEYIPSSFLPRQAETIADTVSDVIVPEAIVPGAEGNIYLSKLWIRMANKVAAKTAVLFRDSPFSDTTCCSTNIISPETFWKNIDELPKLPGRVLIPNKRVPFGQVHFSTRPLTIFSPTIPENIVYRLFLSTCFRGPRIGYPHEPGLNNQCAWCGFQFPTHPATMSSDTEGKSALISQGVPVGKELFEQVLDKVHTIYAVQQYTIPTEVAHTTTISEFAEITPLPTTNWKETISTTINALSQIPTQSIENRSYIVSALGPLSEEVDRVESKAKERLSPSIKNILDIISGLNWTNLFQVLQAYFIIPFHRVISTFNSKSLFVPPELKLSGIHIEDVQKIIDMDTAVVNKLRDIFSQSTMTFARAKVQYFIHQLSAILPFKNRLRPQTLTGKSNTVEYIQRLIVYGPLSELIDPGFIPSDIDHIGLDRIVIDSSIRAIITLVSTSLEKYSREKISFSDAEVRNMIAVRNEKEKTNIIRSMDNMTDDERGIAVLTKQLGIGRWAVGGTSAIYAYDPDQYDREREERLGAGIIDFQGESGFGTNTAGRAVDTIGLYDFGAGGENDGYDHIQTMTDDA